MSWSKARAQARIRRYMETAPVVSVERYSDQYMPRFEAARQKARSIGDAAGAGARALFDLPDGAAVLVDTVQVYVRALSYDEIRLEKGQETERGHARGLSFLHLLYGAGDRVVEKVGGQRVDHHGARMHAVVIEPRGDASLTERIATGVAMAEEMMALARAARREILPDLDVELRFRVGIDVGQCVAINSGRSDEREPVFVGSAANHAAKIAAGDGEGIYLSDRVRAALGLRRAPTLNEERALPASESELKQTRVGSVALRDSAALTRTRLNEWLEDLRDDRVRPIPPSAFQFHQHEPPLRSIDYAALSPSRSIRMPLISLFADLDAYTAYIDRCMVNGRLAHAVQLLHILRSEFNAVLQEDFKGRKVRFIGDSIHGLIAEGTVREVDLAQTVTVAAQCAGALRSSFLLCQEMIDDATALGLAIGFELGLTPISRIGIRGDRAVRTASSLAVRGSERCQQLCDGRQTMIGANAYEKASFATRRLFGPSRIARDLTYDDVTTQVAPKAAAAAIAGASTILSQPVYAEPAARAYAE